MSRDPYEVIRPYKKQEKPPPDPLAEFVAEYPHSGRGHNVGPRQPPAMVGLCVFENGREVRRGFACPHFREPEEGTDG